jgi:hypothetical protein
MQKSKSDSFKLGSVSAAQLNGIVNNITYEDIVKISNVNKANLPNITKPTLEHNPTLKSTAQHEPRLTFSSHKQSSYKSLGKQPLSQFCQTFYEAQNSSFVVLFDNKSYYNIVKPLESLNKQLCTKSPVRIDRSIEFNINKKLSYIAGLRKTASRGRTVEKKEVNPDFKFFKIKPQLQQLKPVKFKPEYVPPRRRISRCSTPMLKVTQDSSPVAVHTPTPLKITRSKPSPISKSPPRRRRKGRVSSHVPELNSATPEVSGIFENEDIYTVKNLASNVTMTPFQELLDLSSFKSCGYNYMKTFDKILKNTPKN